MKNEDKFGKDHTVRLKKKKDVGMNGVATREFLT